MLHVLSCNLRLTKKSCVGVFFSLLAIVFCLFGKLSLLFTLFAVIAFLIIGIFDFRGPKISVAILYAMWVMLGSIVALYISQMYFDVFWGLAKRRIILGMLCCIIPFFLSFAITARVRLSVAVSFFLVLLLSTVNHYVYLFQGNALSPFHFQSFGTAMIVAGGYTIELAPIVARTWICGILYVFLGFVLPQMKPERALASRLTSILFFLTSLWVFSMGSKNIPVQMWGNLGGYENGYLLNFSIQLKQLSIKTPANYSETLLQLSSQYDHPEHEDASVPNIIVVMGEAFSDLSVLGENLHTNEEVLPFFSDLTDNTIKGYALSSVFGGNTANSEFEFLTGNSLAWLPNGSVPYQQFIEDNNYSLVAYLHSLGYYCVAMHPCDPTGWQRNIVYPKLGFDQSHFIDDFPQLHYVRNYVSDMEMVDYLIDTYHNLQSNAPIFLFGVTVQNHGGYAYSGDHYTKTIELDDCLQDYPDVEQYLSILRLSDAALEKLISHFETEDEDVVIVFFGDHLPRLNVSCYEEIHGGAFQTLDEQQLQYKIPFFVWANYDIVERYIPCTSINYLSNYMFDAAGITPSAYNQFLSDLEEIVPAMNSLGYYSETHGHFVSYEEAQGEELEWLNRYKCLQYNNLFGKENLSKVFFEPYQ